MKAASRSIAYEFRVAMRRTALFIVLLSLIGGCCLLWLRPFPTSRQVAEARAKIYQSWHDQTRAAYESFRHLAIENGWSMYVRTYEGPPLVRGLTSVGRLECAESRYAPLYEAQRGRFIESVVAFRAGRTGFTERTTASRSWWRRTKRRDLELGVLYSDGSLTKHGLPEIGHVSHLAMGNRYVFFSELSWSADRLWLYDVPKRTLREVPKLEGWEGAVIDLAVVGDRFLLVVCWDELIVTRATSPFAPVSRVEGVSEMLLVGERIIIEKDNACLLYDPESGETEHLTPGKVVAPLGQNEFLFCRPETAHIGYTRAALQRYNISDRSADVFWQPPKGESGFRLKPGEEKMYDYTEVILSPDRRFLFVPRQIPAYGIPEVLMVLEYDVYDLGSGQKRGSFLTIHEGKFCFEFLGWVEQKEGPVPEPARAN